MSVTTPAEFLANGPGAAFEDLDESVVQYYLDGAEQLAASYLVGRGYGPIATAGNDYRIAIFKIASWDLMTGVRGVNPADPAHAGLKMARDEAVAWLRDVARGIANLGGAAAARVPHGTAAVFGPIDSLGSALDSDGTDGW